MLRFLKLALLPSLFAASVASAHEVISAPDEPELSRISGILHWADDNCDFEVDWAVVMILRVQNKSLHRGRTSREQENYDYGKQNAAAASAEGYKQARTCHAIEKLYPVFIYKNPPE